MLYIPTELYAMKKYGRVDDSGVSRVWQAGHVPWAPLAGGAICFGII
jgi:hypothetical protein